MISWMGSGFGMILVSIFPIDAAIGCTLELFLKPVFACGDFSWMGLLKTMIKAMIRVAAIDTAARLLFLTVWFLCPFSILRTGNENVFTGACFSTAVNNNEESP